MANSVDNELAFTAFVGARRPHLVAMARALLGPGRDDAEDIVQVALIRLASHWSAARDPNAYVRRCIVNLTVDRARRKLWTTAFGGTSPLDNQPDALAEHADRTADRLTLHAALLRLPDRQRQVLSLRYLDGCNEAETAALLRCSVGTVKNTAHKGLVNLRTLVSNNEAAVVVAADGRTA